MSEMRMRDVYNLDNTHALANRIKTNYDDFDVDKFMDVIDKELLDLGLSERSLLIQDTLEALLPCEFTKIVDILLSSQLPLLKNAGDKFNSDFIAVPQTNLIAKLGCNDEYFDKSMEAMYEMTKRFSCEFSIRPFIKHDREKAFKYLHTWVNDDNLHVRRLCSEGIRPKLPWASILREFIEDPTPVLKILDYLYYDNERYVTRSVANCLNDISKTHPHLVIERLIKWESEKKQDMKEFNWIKKHSLRTLIKKGHKETLEYLGFKQDVDIKCNIELKNLEISLNEYLEFKVKLESSETTNLIIDYIIHFKKANGVLKGKVFKLKNLTINKDESLYITKKHLFALMSTRKLYDGLHKISIQVNGKVLCTTEFNLSI